MVCERRKDHFILSTDPARLDIEVIHSFLTRSYWARGIPKELVSRAIANSLCFGLSEDAKQIGFARAVTDCTRFANIMDVFVLEEYRGRGLGAWLMECVMEHLKSLGLAKITLNSSTAQGFYRKFGFKEINPETTLEVVFEMPWFKKERGERTTTVSVGNMPRLTRTLRGSSRWLLAVDIVAISDWLIGVP